MIGGIESFNRYTNLDSIEWKIVQHLLDSNSIYSDNIWKALAYPTTDCLLKPSLTRQEKIQLIYMDDGVSDAKRVFLMPYVDDAWEARASRLDIYVSKITPQNHVVSKVNVTFEIVVHNKINNITSDTDPENPDTNPSELNENGDIMVLVKSRANVLLKNLLAEFNGKSVADGIGQLQHNITMDTDCKTTYEMWNNKAYFGYKVTFCTLMSGLSDGCEDY